MSVSEHTNPARPIPRPASARGGNPPRKPSTTATATDPWDGDRLRPSRPAAPRDPTRLPPVVDSPFAAKLALHRLADLVGGIPGCVVVILLEEDFDRAAAARRLGKSEHYVRTNIERFVRAARRFAETDQYVRFLALIVFRD